MDVFRFRTNPITLLAVATVAAAGFTGIGAATAMAGGSAPALYANPVLPDEDNPVVGQALGLTSPAEFSDEGSVLTHQWLRCSDADPETCQAIPGATSATYTPTADDAGQYLEIVEKATNEFGYAEGPSNLTLKVVWGPPLNTTAPSTGTVTAPVRGTTLHGVAGVWSYATSTAVQWRRCVPAPPRPADAAARADYACTDIPGATSLDYTPDALDVGKFLRLRETATGFGGETSASTEVTLAVQGLPPYYESGPATFPGGTVRVGTTLVATTDGDWHDADAIAGKWQRCVPFVDRPAGSAARPEYECTDIDGATGSAYVTTAADTGKRVRFAVHAVNAWGESNAYTTPQLVQAAPPTVVTTPGQTTDVVAAIADLDVTVGGTLKPDLGRFADADTVVYQYQRCATDDEASCRDIPGATGESYTSTAADVGYRLRVVATATNAGGEVRVASPMSRVVAAAAPDKTVVTPAPPAPAAAPATAAPAAEPAPAAPRVCVSRRSVTLHWRVPRGARVASLTVTVDGKRVAKLGGDRRSAKVALAGRPAGTATVVVTARTRSGATLRTTRRYQTCVSAKDAAKPLATLALKRA